MFESEDRKKRVGKACDSCRMKKTKCDGLKPCSKCSQDNKICTYSEKKKQPEKSYSSGYVELLESRIDILQSSLQKLIIKIAKNEDVSMYVPSTANDVHAINKVIELLGETQEDSVLEFSDSNSQADDREVSSHIGHAEPDQASVVSLATTSSLTNGGGVSSSVISPADSSPWSSSIDEDHDIEEKLQQQEQQLPGLSPSPIDNPLSLGLYRSGAALAAAALSGQYEDLNSPLGFTPTQEELSPVPWGTVSPADINNSRSTASLSDLTTAPRRSIDSPSSSSSLPHHINNGAYSGGHISKLHRVGSPHHIPGQNQPDWNQQRNMSQLNRSQSPYSSYKGTRRRDRSLSKTSSNRAPRHRSADNVVASRATGASAATFSSLSSASSYSSSSPPSPGEAPLLYTASTDPNVPDTRKSAQVASSDVYDDDASFIFDNMGQFVQMEELNSNLDELWLGQMS